MGICTKFTEIGQDIHNVRTKAHSRPYVKNDCHRVDFHENQVFQTSCKERHFRWRNIRQTVETIRSQHICTTYSTGTSLRRKVLYSADVLSWVVYRHKNFRQRPDCNQSIFITCVSQGRRLEARSYDTHCEYQLQVPSNGDNEMVKGTDFRRRPYYMHCWNQLQVPSNGDDEMVTGTGLRRRPYDRHCWYQPQPPSNGGDEMVIGTGFRTRPYDIHCWYQLYVVSNYSDEPWEESCSNYEPLY